MAIGRNSVRLLPVADWPQLDRHAWASVTREGDILDGAGTLHALAPCTLRNYRASYGRWLSFLLAKGLLDPTSAPVSRATPTAVVAFVDELRGQVASLTLAQRIIGLEQVLRAFAPDTDWTWLRRMARRLFNVARPVREKRSRIRPIDEIEAAGRSLMAEAEAAIGRSLRRRGDLYCDGLMIALLARRPLRLSNFAQIRLEVNLLPAGAGWTLWFPAEETKTRTALELPFPEDLIGHLDRYLTHWRRVLLGKGSSDRLWISLQGKPLIKEMINLRIRRATARCLGSPLWPHLFRDCLATHIAIDDPEHVRIATALLGHRNSRTTERTYNLAGQRQAAAAWHTALLQRRRIAERRLRRN